MRLIGMKNACICRPIRSNKADSRCVKTVCKSGGGKGWAGGRKRRCLARCCGERMDVV
jgi:hypothetical protein